MIDISSEQVISLTQATRVLPRRRKGSKPHIATLYRWAQRGCRGIVLESVQVGGTRCTSVEALQRFCDRLTGKPVSKPPTATASESKRLGAVDAALDAAGL